MPEFPHLDRPSGGADPFAPTAGCAGTIVGVLVACLLAYIGIRVLSAESSGTTSIGICIVAVLAYIGLLLFSLRTRDVTRRRFTRAVLVTVPIAVAVVFAVVFAVWYAMLRGAAFPV